MKSLISPFIASFVLVPLSYHLQYSCTEPKLCCFYSSVDKACSLVLLYLLHVPISLFRISLLGQGHRERSVCGCRWPPLFLDWLLVDGSCLREEWAVIRVSESAPVLQIEWPATKKSVEGQEILQQDTLLFNNVQKEARRCFHWAANHEQKHSPHSLTFTLLLMSYLESIGMQYGDIAMCVCFYVCGETKAACLQFFWTGSSYSYVPATMAKQETCITLWHCLLLQSVDWEITT